MSDPLIPLPDGSFVRASQIRAIRVRQSARFGGIKSLDGVVVDLANGTFVAIDAAGPDEAREEAKRLAGLCDA